jgi:uncharacterized protein GlcG (DUF336 family)
MTLLTLKEAEAIVAAGLKKAREMSFEPMTISVLDASGTLKAMSREDGSGLVRPDIAFSKAWGTLGMGLPSRELGRRNDLMPNFFGALNIVSQGRVVPMPGGVLILREGQLVGAVGATGDTSDNDEVCAIAGIEAAGLVADYAAEPQVRPSEF